MTSGLETGSVETLDGRFCNTRTHVHTCISVTASDKLHNLHFFAAIGVQVNLPQPNTKKKSSQIKVQKNARFLNILLGPRTT